MRTLIAPLASLLSGVALLVLGVGLLFSVIGLRAGLSDFSTLTTGLVMSAYFAGTVVGVLYCPLLIRRVGHIRSFAAMASMASTMPILHALWVDPWFWALLRLLTGVCLVGLYIVIESWLNTLAPRDQRGKVFGLYMTVNCLAAAIGQWLILVGDRLGFVPFALVSVLLSFALVPITLTPVREPAVVEAPRFGLRRLYRISPLGVSGAFSAGLLVGALLGLGATFVQRQGHEDSTVAAFMALTLLGGAVLQWPLGHLSDRFDRRGVLLILCTGLALLAAAGWWLIAREPLALLPLGITLGALISTVYGLSVAHVNDLIDPSQSLEVTGSLLLVNGIGASIGPTLAGALMGGFGPGGLLLYFAAVAAAQAGFTVHRMRVAPPVPAEAKSDFMPMASSSQAVLQLDPRAEDSQLSRSR